MLMAKKGWVREFYDGLLASVAAVCLSGTLKFSQIASQNGDIKRSFSSPGFFIFGSHL